VFEKILAKQLMGFCRVNNVIPPEQFGFRDSSSCEFALLNALDSWMDSIDSGKVVGALLIDLSKAFDIVSHQQLLVELSSIGCGLNTIKFFLNYLSNEQQRIVQGKDITDWFNVS